MHKFSENPGEPINTFVVPFVFTDKVAEAVESIWANHTPEEHRLILIDNSGEDYLYKKQLEELSHIYIKCYRNVGPAVAFNLGIQMARTKYVTIMSDDARLIHKKWIHNAIGLIEATEKNNIQYFDVNKHYIISLGSIYPQSADVGDFYDGSKTYTEEDYSNLCRKYESKRNGFGLACAIAKKETWLKSGLFDESKYIYTIDGTFADQANKNGVDTVYQGVCFHYGDASHKGRLVKEGKFHQIGLLNEKQAVL